MNGDTDIVERPSRTGDTTIDFTKLTNNRAHERLDSIPLGISAEHLIVSLVLYVDQARVRNKGRMRVVPPDNAHRSVLDRLPNLDRRGRIHFDVDVVLTSLEGTAWEGGFDDHFLGS